MRVNIQTSACKVIKGIGKPHIVPTWENILVHSASPWDWEHLQNNSETYFTHSQISGNYI